MNDLKTLLFYLLAPLALLYFITALVFVVISAVLWIAGFRETSELIISFLPIPMDLWLSIAPWKDL